MTITGKEKLFQKFPSVSTQEWEELIKSDLKGAGYDKRLVWQTLEGFKLKPYYRQEDTEELSYLQSFFSKIAKQKNHWEIRQDILIDKEKTANTQALDILNRGISAIGFEWPSHQKNLKINLPKLVQNIPLSEFGLYLSGGKHTTELFDQLISFVLKENFDATKIHGGLSFDPITQLAFQGNWSENEKSDLETVSQLIKKTSDCLPNYYILSIHGKSYHNAGSTAVQELAFSISLAADYLSILTETGIQPVTIANSIQLCLGIGTNYFMEITKIRAARYLFAKLFEAFKIIPHPIHINSYTSDWYNTIYDPYVNILRNTTEAMAAIIGGTDTLVVQPFDAAHKAANDFSERIARNIQIILKEEAYFDKVADPAGGSYYIDNITDTIINESWKLFLDIETKGGFLQCLKDGIIQKQIKEVAIKRTDRIATRKDILVGTNQYANSSEKKAGVIEEKPRNHNQTDKKTIETIPLVRVAEAYENLRLKTEQMNNQLKIFLLPFGDKVTRNARANFSANFFAPAGYEIIHPPGYDSFKQGIEDARSAHPNLIVLCSSNKEYAQSAIKAYHSLKDIALIVVAGAPACMEELKQAGIEFFIHLRSNHLETLNKFYKKLTL